MLQKFLSPELDAFDLAAFLHPVQLKDTFCDIYANHEILHWPILRLIYKDGLIYLYRWEASIPFPNDSGGVRWAGLARCLDLDDFKAEIVGDGFVRKFGDMAVGPDQHVRSGRSFQQRRSAMAHCR
jgi:hypothetical protein